MSHENNEYLKWNDTCDKKPTICLFCSNCTNFADWCTEEVEFRICTNCKIFTTEYTNRLKNLNVNYILSTYASVCYFFTINAFINVYNYFFGRLTHLWFVVLAWPLLMVFPVWSFCSAQMAMFCIGLLWLYLRLSSIYRVGQIKWHHFTFLLVTN